MAASPWLRRSCRGSVQSNPMELAPEQLGTAEACNWRHSLDEWFSHGTRPTSICLPPPCRPVNHTKHPQGSATSMPRRFKGSQSVRSWYDGHIVWLLVEWQNYSVLYVITVRFQIHLLPVVLCLLFNICGIVASFRLSHKNNQKYNIRKLHRAKACESLLGMSFCSEPLESIGNHNMPGFPFTSAHDTMLL